MSDEKASRDRSRFSPLGGYRHLAANWMIRLGDLPVREWSWEDCGAPPLTTLLPVRKPQSSEHNRHIPVRAFCVTNDDHIELESGLEHDLLRQVDRLPDVVRVIAQPFRLSWETESGQRGHTPDLMTVHSNGGATVWDARMPADQDVEFQTKAWITGAECDRVEWHYRIFPGMSQSERLNHLWLNGFRRQQPWLKKHEYEIRAAAVRPGADLRALFSMDDGTGEVIASVWYLIWSGALEVDLSKPLGGPSPVSLKGDSHV